MTYTPHHDITDAMGLLLNAGVDYKRNGRHEIEADIDNVGHYSFKINLDKGLWFTTDGSGRKGNLFTLAKLFGYRVSHPEYYRSHDPRRDPREEKRIDAENGVLRAQRLYYSGTALDDFLGDMAPFAFYNHADRRRVDLSLLRDKFIRFVKPDPEYDHAEIEAGCTDIVLFPMYEFVSSHERMVCGVQRLYLKENGEKITRKTLGKQGVMMLPNVSRKNVIILGEGVETVMSVYQTFGHCAIITYNANNLLTFAERLARELSDENAKRKNKKPSTMEVWLLVDRDVSGTGQRVCARAAALLKEVGVTVYYLEPPEEVKGGNKGADWNDALLEMQDLRHRDESMRALIGIANAQAEDKLQEAMQRFGVDSKPTQPPVWNMQQTERHVTPVDVEINRDKQRYITSRIVRGAVYASDKKPWLIGPTMGSGKTKAILDVINERDCPPTLVTVNDYNEVESYAATNPNIKPYMGRTPDEKSPAFCPQYHVASALGENGHLPQAEYCWRCPSGFKYTLLNSTKEENRANAMAKLAEYGYPVGSKAFDELKTCRWLQHQKDTMRQKHVVAVHQSFSPTLATYVNGNGDSVPRRVIMDEKCALTTHREITFEHIDRWARQRDEAELAVARNVEFYREEAEAIVDFNGQSPKKKEALKKYRKAKRVLDALIAAKAVLQSLAEALPKWLGKEGKIQLDATIHEQLQQLIKAALIVAGKKKRVPTTSEWEKAVFDKGAAKVIPLRALTAVALTLEHGDGFVRDGKLHVVDTSSCYDAVIDYGAIVLDATPSRTVIDLIKSAGGEVHLPVAKQNVNIYRHPTRFWGTTPWNDTMAKDRRQQEEERYAKLLSHHHGQDSNTAFLLHKNARAFFDEKHSGAFDVGHWGADHRAHNRWAGKNMVMVGSFWPPKHKWREMYLADRVVALASGANPDLWPAWPEDMAYEKVWVHESGNTEVKSLVDLPKDKTIQEWLLEMATNETVQAIGRARPINAPDDAPVEVHIYGGLPLFGLHKHGLEVADYLPDPDCLNRSRGDMHEQQRKDADRRFDRAATKAVLAGKRITRETLYDILSDEDGALVNRKIVCTTNVEDYYVGGTNEKTPRPASYTRWLNSRLADIAGVLSATGRNAKRVEEAMRQAAAKIMDACDEDGNDEEGFDSSHVLDVLERAAVKAWRDNNEEDPAWDVFRGEVTDILLEYDEALGDGTWLVTDDCTDIITDALKDDPPPTT